METSSVSISISLALYNSIYIYIYIYIDTVLYIYLYLYGRFSSQPRFDYPRVAFKTSPESSIPGARVLSYSHLDFG